jgi:hypothetical protein
MAPSKADFGVEYIITIGFIRSTVINKLITEMKSLMGEDPLIK